MMKLKGEEMTKAYSYLRVSGIGQVAGDGFPRQRAAIAAYAAARDLSIEREFVEEGVTGKMEACYRPAWFDMLLALKSNGVRTIIIERLDRLARDLMVQEHIIADIQRAGIELVSTAEPDLDSTDPTRVLMRQIMGAIAQYDRAMIVLKLRGARQRKKALTGRCEGAKPFGLDPKRPDEAPIRQQILAMCRNGAGFEDIARHLNAMGVKTRHGKPWLRATIQHIAQSELKKGVAA